MVQLSSSYLSNLPDPDVIAATNYESILKEMTDEVLAYAPELEPALSIESDPFSKIIQALSYRILHERMLSNDYGLSLMLAKGKGVQLDNLGALPFLNTPRKVLIEEDSTVFPEIEKVTESDDEYRIRLHIALEGFSTAGPAGAYIYHGLSSHESIVDIAIDAPSFIRYQPPSEGDSQLPDNAIVLIPDYTAGLDNPEPGDIAVTALSREGDGTVHENELAELLNALNGDKIRPVNDNPRVRSAEIKSYSVVAEIWFYPGPDSSIATDLAYKETIKYTESLRKIGHQVPESGLDAAIHQPGVQRVNILEPIGGVNVLPHESAYCTDIQLINKGLAI